MKEAVKDDKWRIPDELWAKIEPLLPPRKQHPWGCHNPRVPDRAAMDAIFLVLRTGMQWNALNATGICSSSSAHRRFQEWSEAGVFRELWKSTLQEYDALKGIQWDWQSMDGAMTKAPLGGEKNRTKSYGSGQIRGQTKRIDRWSGDSARGSSGTGEQAGFPVGAGNAGERAHREAGGERREPTGDVHGQRV